jgi:DNA-binding NtrC family response regulator
MAGNGSARTLLVIATDEALRRLLRALFKSHGYEVELVSSADQAVALFESARFGAVIIDADARGENVGEFLSSLDGHGARLIALTTGPLSVDDTRLRATLMKPFELERLTAIVEATYQ